MSVLHTHLVFVTKYRRPVFTDEMLTFCENTMRAVRADLDVELVEFNGETDNLHPLVAYPPTLPIAIHRRNKHAHVERRATPDDKRDG